MENENFPTLSWVRLSRYSPALSGIFFNSISLDFVFASVFSGASSHSIQKAILAEMLELGFTSEKKLLFNEYKVGGLRPDYYKPLSKGGILFEVERGKTIANNMDLLDVWKTHICKEANHLFLLVPNIRVSKNQNEAKIFPSVKNRIETFFNENISAIDVDSVHLFGY